MSGQKVCDDLLKTPWQKYDTKSSSAPEKPGIYAIGQKGNNGEETKYLYVGQSNNMKRRLQEHKSPTPQQYIDKRVAGKFKQHRESELRIKCVETKRQKTVEGPCIESLTKKKGYFPVLNKSQGDGAACSMKSSPQKSRPKVQSSGGGYSSVRTIRPSGGTSYVRASGSASWFSSKARPVPTVRASFGASRRRK